MKTFSEELKQLWITVMQGHQDADRLSQGNWWDNGDQKGCFFGCAMQTENNPLQKAIKAMQLPAWLVHLAEAIFEGLSKDDALLFPVQLLQAIPTNTDISEVIHIIAVERLEPLIRESNSDEANKAIKLVIGYHKNTERTEKDRKEAYSAARTAKYSAAHSAAQSAARQSAAASAARSAARQSAADSAYPAAYPAERSWQQERDNLLQALREFKK